MGLTGGGDFFGHAAQQPAAGSARSGYNATRRLLVTEDALLAAPLWAAGWRARFLPTNGRSAHHHAPDDYPGLHLPPRYKTITPGPPAERWYVGEAKRTQRAQTNDERGESCAASAPLTAQQR